LSAQSRCGFLLRAGGGAPPPRRCKGRAIVNISSVLGLGVSKGTVAYAVSKAGVIQLTKTLALELAFKAFASMPSRRLDRHELNRDYLASEKGRAITRDIPVGRFGEPRDLDGALLLLVSTPAASSPADRGDRRRAGGRAAGIGFCLTSP